MEIKSIQFRTTVLADYSRIHSVFFEPKEKIDVINNFLLNYSSSTKVQLLISELEMSEYHDENNPKYISYNECHIYADNNKVVFDMEVVTGLKPIILKTNDAISFFNLYKEYLRRYENSEISGLQPLDNNIETEWDYIQGWEEKGVIEPKHLVKWAYVNNGYFSEQDEDLLMYRPELIGIMHELMTDKYSKRKDDLLKILMNYVNQTYSKTLNLEAKAEFEKLLGISMNDKRHTELRDYIIDLKNNYL